MQPAWAPSGPLLLTHSPWSLAANAFASLRLPQVRQNAAGSGVRDSEDASEFEKDIALDQADHVPDPVHTTTQRWSRANSTSDVAAVGAATAAAGAGGAPAAGGGAAASAAVSYVGVFNSEGAEVSLGAYCAKQVLPTVDGGARREEEAFCWLART